jgi:hypothetical protein
MLKKSLLGIAAALVTTTAAWAGPQFESTRSTCTTINCAGMTIRGIIQGPEPFVVQIYARAGECLRLDVSTQTEDLAMTLTGPSVLVGGAIADDRDPPSDLRPLIVYNLLDATGWYTVIVSLRDTANVDARFTLEYGRYPGGNPNCFS